MTEWLLAFNTPLTVSVGHIGRVYYPCQLRRSYQGEYIIPVNYIGRVYYLC